ncbi:MAG TPA: flagellar export chaperone FliS [Bryobacteraceae bacterium]|nr:flagellar export chaperone FliS [Bryobacteraceae bacterium]
MATSAYQTYAESKVLSADPLELIEILYEAALESVNRARQYLRDGDIPARSNQISHCCAILVELSQAVRPEPDPALAQNLIELYDYMQRRVLDAHMQQADAPLAEVGKLLSTLLEGWSKCRAEVAPTASELPEMPEGRALAAAGRFDEPPAYVSQGWTA